MIPRAAEDDLDRRQLARYRYPLRPLLCSLPEGAAPGGVLGRGIIVRSRRAVARGRALLVRLPGLLGGPVTTYLARVVRVTREPGGEYVLGCDFTPPLNEQELAAVSSSLRQPA